MREGEYLDLTIIPTYRLSSFRYFSPHEHHCARICQDDVLLLVLGGVLRFEEDGRAIEVHPGEWFIQHAGGYQSGPAESDTPAYYYIHFHGAYTKSRHNALGLRGVFDIQRTLPLLKALDQCGDQMHGCLDHCLHFFHILTYLSDEEKNIMPHSSLCMEIAEYIHQNYQKGVSLLELEQRFSYSRDHIIRMFRALYGVTPYQYQTLCRINFAKNIMASSHRFIGEIAQACGYRDTTAFYRAFTKYAGCSPSQWQQKMTGIPMRQAKSEEA